MSVSCSYVEEFYCPPNDAAPIPATVIIICINIPTPIPIKAIVQADFAFLGALSLLMKYKTAPTIGIQKETTFKIVSKSSLS